MSDSLSAAELPTAERQALLLNLCDQLHWRAARFNPRFSAGVITFLLGNYVIRSIFYLIFGYKHAKHEDPSWPIVALSWLIFLSALAGLWWLLGRVKTRGAALERRHVTTALAQLKLSVADSASEQDAHWMSVYGQSGTESATGRAALASYWNLMLRGMRRRYEMACRAARQPAWRLQWTMHGCWLLPAIGLLLILLTQALEDTPVLALVDRLFSLALLLVVIAFALAFIWDDVRQHAFYSAAETQLNAELAQPVPSAGTKVGSISTQLQSAHGGAAEHGPVA